MRGKSKAHRWLWRPFWLSVLGVTGYLWYYMDRAVPDRVSILENEEEIFDFNLPLKATIFSESREVSLGGESNIPADQITINRSEQFSMFAGEQGSYQVGLKLFGLIKLKDIRVDVVDTRYAVPCGDPIGIYLKSDGIMVIGTGRITGEDGMEREPAYGKLKSGDYIEAFNGKTMDSKEELIKAVNDTQGEEAVVTVRREGEAIDVSLQAVKSAEGDYKLGAWVRDDTQGIGTVTYVDMNGRFGALGHGISDSDTGELVETGQGSLYTTQIMGIEKGSVGSPGLLSGVIYYGPQSKMGDIEKNTSEGIFGMVNEAFMEKIQGDPVEVARRQDVKQGTAYIRSSISGETRDYAIEIQRVDFNASHKNKSMVIKVTDPALLELTGGIVQGMSGSPILQDGKLVGAVTHVFVQDAARGYGILAEDMILN